jgi:hypothetical protein
MTWEYYNGTEFGNLTIHTSEPPVKVCMLLVLAAY